MKSITGGIRSFRCACVGATLGIFLTLTAQGHDPGLSTATVTIGEQQIDVLLGFAKQDALMLQASDVSGNLETARGFHGIKDELESLAKGQFELFLEEEQLVPLQVGSQLKDDQNVEILLQFKRSTASHLRVSARFLERLPLGHREFLSVQKTDGVTLSETMLSAKKNGWQVDLPVTSIEPSPSPDSHSFLEFLKLGVEHILTGYDHLLFLFGLMVVCRNLRSLLTVITCFTLAHSITLALATLDIVRLPGRVVEPMIAASIAYVGVENLIRGESPNWRTVIAFSFGLVHGLGFADALRELGINSGQFGFVVPLVGFNLGVELGQLSVVTIVLPILWRLRRNPLFVRRWVPVCSIAVALAGSYWMVERIAQN